MGSDGIMDDEKFDFIDVYNNIISYLFIRLQK